MKLQLMFDYELLPAEFIYTWTWYFYCELEALCSIQLILSTTFYNLRDISTNKFSCAIEPIKQIKLYEVNFIKLQICRSPYLTFLDYVQHCYSYKHYCITHTALSKYSFHLHFVNKYQSEIELHYSTFTFLNLVPRANDCNSTKSF